MSLISRIFALSLLVSPFLSFAAQEVSANGKYIAAPSSTEIVIKQKKTQKEIPARVPARKSCLLAFIPIDALTNIIWGYLADPEQNAKLKYAVGHFNHIDSTALMIEAIEDGATNLDDALFTAVERHALNRIELLLAYGANPNSTSNKDPILSTPLIAAIVYFGHATTRMCEIVELLLKAGAQPEKENAKGQSLLTFKDNPTVELKVREALNALCEKYAK